MSRARRLQIACLGVLLTAAVAPTVAPAQRAYVANSASNSVSIFDTATNASLGQIPVGVGPSDIAISPGGARAYVTNTGADTVSVIDIATNATIATIPVGDEPRGIALTPSGARAYLANTGDDTVSVIDTATNSALGAPLAVGNEPESVAITPEGIRGLVAQRGGDIAIFNVGAGALVGSIPDPLGPSKLALTPDGTRGFVTNRDSNSVNVFSLASGTVLGSAISVGANPAGIALSPHGAVYASSSSDNTVTMIDPITHARIGSPIPGFAGPAGIAASVDGRFAYVVNSAGQSVSVIDAASASVIAQVPTGASPQGIAIVPDQPPRAAFTAAPAPKQGQQFSFDASPSVDPDGQVGIYAWDFGDGQSESSQGPSIEHAYEKPGTYRVTLTTTDQQGCSTTLLFTGQTASCNGSGIARTSVQVEAIDTTPPVLRLFGARRQFLGPAVSLIARCPTERCAVVASGMLQSVSKPRGPKGKSIRFRQRSRRAKTGIPAGGRARINLKLSRKARVAARRSLARDGRVGFKVNASATDRAGNKVTRKFTVSLIAPQRRAASKGR